MEEYAWEQLPASDAILMGRGVYEVFAASWPFREAEFADRMNSLPKFVHPVVVGRGKRLFSDGGSL